MQVFRSLSTPQRRHNRRTLYDSAASIKWVRDRGLDHAVLREKNLKPLLNLKNLIKSEPSKSLPLSIITSNKDSLQIPTRPIEFIRRYPSVFEEYFPGNISIHPHIKLSSEALSLDAEENLLYQSADYKQDLADRMLKLLMIGRVNKIPLGVFDRLKWELGLPQDFVTSILLEFPDYFTVKKGKSNLGGNDEEMIELVCWSNELAVSVIHKKPVMVGAEKRFQFPLKYTKGFEMDNKHTMWVDEWQKLPYVSPYENAMHLAPTSDEADKWAVVVLHEILNLFVGKKAEKESLPSLGEVWGLRSRFKRALFQHPGIFYISSKNWTHTVVLRDGYKRGILGEKDALMDMRFKYVRLMNTVREGDKTKSLPQEAGLHLKEGEREAMQNDLTDEEEVDDEMYDQSNEDTSDEYGGEDDDKEDDYDDMSARNRGRLSKRTTREEEEKVSRNLLRSRAEANSRKIMDGMRPRFFSRRTVDDGEKSKSGANFRKNVDGMRPRFSRRTDHDSENLHERSCGRSRIPHHFRGRSDTNRATTPRKHSAPF